MGKAPLVRRIDETQVRDPVSVGHHDILGTVGRAVIGDDEFPWLRPLRSDERIELRADDSTLVETAENGAELHRETALSYRKLSTRTRSAGGAIPTKGLIRKARNRHSGRPYRSAG